ncbi:MAG: hypothetical protein KF708_24605 [Pirellulales bacterium]|nr:hypothetical protein [Pirellulales bacterium]
MSVVFQRPHSFSNSLLPGRHCAQVEKKTCLSGLERRESNRGRRATARPIELFVGRVSGTRSFQDRQKGRSPVRSAILALLHALAFLLFVRVPVAAGPLQTLHQFDWRFPGSTSAGTPYGGVITDGTKLYGTGFLGGANGLGAIYSLNLNGSNYQTLHSFGLAQGSEPESSLVLIGSTLYGTAANEFNTPNVTGTVFSISTSGSSFQVLHSFLNSEGSSPRPGLVALDSRLYGTTTAFGTNGRGALFGIDPSGANFQVTRPFTTGDGTPGSGGLTVVGERLFGIASGGASGNGEIYAVDPDGSDFQVIFSFPSQVLGKDPRGTMLLVGDRLFGTTYAGGTSNLGSIFSLNTDGTDFQSLKSFGGADGVGPLGGMTRIGDRLYGTTGRGGIDDKGTLFSLRLDGSDYQIVHHFEGGDDGGAPQSALMAHGNTLYGTTGGGALGYGTVFAVTVPEPSSLVLAILGIAGYGAIATRTARWRMRGSGSLA